MPSPCWSGEQASSFSVARRPLPSDVQPPAVDPGLALAAARAPPGCRRRRTAGGRRQRQHRRGARGLLPRLQPAGRRRLAERAQSNWFSAPSRFWSLGPQGLLTVFDFGAHAAQAAEAHAAYDEQVANYRGTVLTAFQDVEDNLAALRQLERESVSQAAAVEATQGALDQANYRYKGGIVTYLEVVSTENAALAARLAALDIETQRLTSTVLLVQALGGDWQNPHR